MRGEDSVIQAPLSASPAPLEAAGPQGQGQGQGQRTDGEVAQPGPPGPSSIAPERPYTTAHPEECPTYEAWLATFAELPEFPSSDGTWQQVPMTPGGEPGGGPGGGRAPRQGHRRVLGDRAARRPPEDGHAPPPHDPAQDAPRVENPQPSDRFIDHPTEAWVQAHFPPELCAMVYQLPANHADVMLILRHVWLHAHGRTEHHQTRKRLWTLGREAGQTEAQRRGYLRDLFLHSVSSHSIQALVQPYADVLGNPLRSLAALGPLLHPGDLLVWEHRRGDPAGAWRRTGGHCQTIQTIARDPQNPAVIHSITCIQGNRPLFRREARDIRAVHGNSAGAEEALCDAPGRRLERDVLEGHALDDKMGVWSWIDGRDSDGSITAFTVLLAAGPYRTAPRPSMRPPDRGQRGQRQQRHLGDWLPELRRAPTPEELQALVEAALQEVRATVEGGGWVAHLDAQALGTAAGERLWRLARQADDLGHTSHHEPLHRIRSAIRALGDIEPRSAVPHPRADAVRALFAATEDAFHLAARGATVIDFHRPETPTYKVLLTGFDPFEAGAEPPAPGDWNPSGAAVLALDGSLIDSGDSGGARIAVEGVVLPVSFAEFTGPGRTEGIVERLLRPWIGQVGQVDAIVTVSMERRRGADQPVRLEQFSVGVHQTRDLRIHHLVPMERHPSELVPIPLPSSVSLNLPIIESNVDLVRLAEDTAQVGRAARIPTPEIGVDVLLEFATPDEADRALAALRQPPQGTAEVTLRDAAAIRRLMRTQSWENPPLRGAPARICFQVRQDTFTALLKKGPGGNFLSNEVAFRTQTLLSQESSRRRPLSFHVHTQGSTPIPTQGTPTEQRQAMQQARQLRATLIETLRAMIQALAEQLRRRP